MILLLSQEGENFSPSYDCSLKMSYFLAVFQRSKSAESLESHHHVSADKQIL